MRRRSPSRTASVSGGRARRSPYRRVSSSSSGSSYRRSASSSSSGSSREKEAVKMQEIAERLEEVERINAKLEKKGKEKEFKFTKLGCENQYKFNIKIKDLYSEKLRIELKKHFKDGLPEKIEELIKEGEKEIDDENHKLKIANEFGFKAVEEFTKEDLARDEKEEKKIKSLRKEKKEREEKSRSYRGNRGGRDSFRSFKDGYRGLGDSYKDRKFEGKKYSKESGDKTKADVKCYNCQGFGHMARDCSKPQSGGRGRK